MWPDARYVASDDRNVNTTGKLPASFTAPVMSLAELTAA